MRRSVLRSAPTTSPCPFHQPRLARWTRGSISSQASTAVNRRALLPVFRVAGTFLCLQQGGSKIQGSLTRKYLYKNGSINRLRLVCSAHKMLPPFAPRSDEYPAAEERPCGNRHLTTIASARSLANAEKMACVSAHSIPIWPSPWSQSHPPTIAWAIEGNTISIEGQCCHEKAPQHQYEFQHDMPRRCMVPATATASARCAREIGS
ncbi:hypothetical protein BDV95DRAFT_5697 [Massariosphaeria phaeospora]|uniref:Uncharacterized protein n=1 Tax=Massariosphaeria phaeospora TaxID=100035 RepID=A0A7C8IQV2_9PLEO|nr:hypothetical protein BDV95DRAFT_5697 [Massariosphaeria phaeospora]